jgi:hypothetical protein
MKGFPNGERSAIPSPPVDLDPGVDHAVALVMETAKLRRERDELMARYCAGDTSDQDLRRYRAVRLTLGLHHSSAHRPHLPSSVDDVLRRRAELLVELLIGPETADPPVAS